MMSKAKRAAKEREERRPRTVQEYMHEQLMVDVERMYRERDIFRKVILPQLAANGFDMEAGTFIKGRIWRELAQERWNEIRGYLDLPPVDWIP